MVKPPVWICPNIHTITWGLLTRVIKSGIIDVNTWWLNRRLMFVCKNLSCNFNINLVQTEGNISDISLYSSREVLRHESCLRSEENWEIWQIMLSFVANIGHGPNGECQPQMLWQVLDWNVPDRTRGLIFSCREEYESQSLFHYILVGWESVVRMSDISLLYCYAVWCLLCMLDQLFRAILRCLRTEHRRLGCQ